MTFFANRLIGFISLACNVILLCVFLFNLAETPAPYPSALSFRSSALQNTSAHFLSHVPYWASRGDFAPIWRSSDQFGVPPEKFHSSRHDEDKFAVNTFFFGLVGGTVLETGVFDGDNFSTSLYFERHLAWRAVHIEANFKSFEKLRVSRPISLNINAVLCNEFQNVTYVHSSVPGISAAAEFADSEYLANFLPISNQDARVVATCWPLVPVMAHFGITHVHFWMLNIEQGAQFLLLNSIDFSLVTFDVIAIVADQTVPLRNRNIKEHLLSNGFAYYGRTYMTMWFLREKARVASNPQGCHGCIALYDYALDPEAENFWGA